MTTRRIIVALSVVAVLGALAAMIALAPTATPTAAQGQSQPEPTLNPTNTPEPIAEEDAEEQPLALLKQYCRDGQVYDLYASITEVGDERGVSLEWGSDLQHWDLPEGTLAYYRIERQTHAREAPTGKQWQVVDTVHSTDVWKGPVETGHWHYRVRLIGLVSGDLVHECEQVKWAETEVDVLTRQEELEWYCESAYVSSFTAIVGQIPGGQSETVTLEWWLAYDYDYYYDYIALLKGTTSTYRIERALYNPGGNKGGWETVAYVNDTNTWTGAAEPGKWVYRVALISLQAGDLKQKCEKPNWGETDVWIPTSEERAREASDRRILIEQATACATDALTANLSPAAQEVVARHIKQRVAEVAGESELAADLVPLVVMFCADTGNNAFFGLDNTTFILLTLFDYDATYY